MSKILCHFYQCQHSKNDDIYLLTTHTYTVTDRQTVKHQDITWYMIVVVRVDILREPLMLLKDFSCLNIWNVFPCAFSSYKCGYMVTCQHPTVNSCSSNNNSYS